MRRRQANKNKQMTRIKKTNWEWAIENGTRKVTYPVVPGVRYLGSRCTWGTYVPGVQMYLGFRCTWGPAVPGVQLYLGSSCTWGLVVPGVQLYLGSSCNWGLVVPGVQLYLGSSCTWGPVGWGQCLYLFGRPSRETLPQGSRKSCRNLKQQISISLHFSWINIHIKS